MCRTVSQSDGKCTDQGWWHHETDAATDREAECADSI